MITIGKLLSVTVLLILPRVMATEYHIAPNGTRTGNGSATSPWDLATALAQPRVVKPGDTLWLHGGTYVGTFTCRLNGKPGAPVTLRQAPGEQAVIDCQPVPGKDPAALFSVEGDDAVLWGFEVKCSLPNRVTTNKGSSVPDIARGGINCSGSRVRFINLVVHDTNQGFGFWSSGEGGEIYGCLIYNNGWIGPDRGHGHGIYTQNKTGIKRIVDNILFNQFGYGIHAYGSKRAFLEGYQIEGNIAFDNGSSKSPTTFEPNIHIGGDTPASRVSVRSNFTYQVNLEATTARFGYGKTNEDLLCEGNYFAGRTQIQLWKKLTAENNVFAGASTVAEIYLCAGLDPANYVWKQNQFLNGAITDKTLVLNAPEHSSAADLQTWRGFFGLLNNSSAFASPLRGVNVFVRPNEYEPGRANIVVYNWEKQPRVNVDLPGVLKPGQRFTIVSAQDYFGAPVVTGTFDGSPVQLPMAASRPARPIGLEPSQPLITEPSFGAYVVRLAK